MLLPHRDGAGPDEGPYAFTNDMGLRPWHAAVKRTLGIVLHSAVTGPKLKASSTKSP